MQTALPFSLERPDYLDGTLAGDKGFDPLKLTTRYSKGLVRYKDLKDHIKNMQKSKYERDIQARRNKTLTGLPEPASLRR